MTQERKLPGTGGSQPAVLRRDAEEQQEDVRSIQRASGFGVVIWPAFFLLDIYMACVVFPAVSLLRFLVLRLVGESVIVGCYWMTHRPKPRLQTVRAAMIVMATVASTCISLMALSTGGLTSPYLHGLSIITLVLAVLIPAPGRVSLRYLMPAALMFPIVFSLAALFDPGLGTSWRAPHELALFGAHYVFVLAATAIATIGGHRVWAARRQVYEARRLGRYRLKAPIGEGSMNEVWLAWDDTLQRDVALKILRVSATTDRRLLDRFVREARALSRLSSPHTVRVFDFGASDDGLWYIAMEYLAGANLSRLVQEGGPLTQERAIRFTRQTCKALAEAHAAGIVHRDIKPANLIVTHAGTETDVLKVVDFGIARVLEPGPDASLSMVVAGTPDYMAPEIWAGAPADARSDIYALGATLYYMLAGRPPFGGGELVEVARAHGDQVAAPPSQWRGEALSGELEALVSRCLAKAPEERPADAAALLAALDGMTG